jgi:hypothetical protein
MAMASPTTLHIENELATILLLVYDFVTCTSRPCLHVRHRSRVRSHNFQDISRLQLDDGLFRPKDRQGTVQTSTIQYLGWGYVAHLYPPPPYLGGKDKATVLPFAPDELLRYADREATLAPAARRGHTTGWPKPRSLTLVNTRIIVSNGEKAKRGG